MVFDIFSAHTMRSQSFVVGDGGWIGRAEGVRVRMGGWWWMGEGDWLNDVCSFVLSALKKKSMQIQTNKTNHHTAHTYTDASEVMFRGFDNQTSKNLIALINDYSSFS